MLSHDDQFLYIAATLPRSTTRPQFSPDKTPRLPGGARVRGDQNSFAGRSANNQPVVQFEGRTHDADLSGFDRLKICLDTDNSDSSEDSLNSEEQNSSVEVFINFILIPNHTYSLFFTSTPNKNGRHHNK